MSSPAQALQTERPRHLGATAGDKSNLTRFAPLMLGLAAFLLYLLTATGFHTYDSVSYMRDMTKPFAALLLPHHLMYEPSVLALYSAWQLFGWTGLADTPGEMLSSLAGAGTIALFYAIARRGSGSSAVALSASLLLGLSYGFWFYSVEVDVYVLPLFFLLLAAWFLLAGIQNSAHPSYLFFLAGASQAGAVLYHQAGLFAAPAFLLGVLLVEGRWQRRAWRSMLYGLGLAVIVVPAYVVAGVLVAGQHTIDSYIQWFNSYGELGTWGAFSPDTFSNTVSGASAAISSDFWTGCGLLVVLILAALAGTRLLAREMRSFAWLLWAWFGTYAVFFAWWQPEVLKFWVLVLPPLLLLCTIAIHRQTRKEVKAVVSIIAAAALIALIATNAPVIWAKRGPMSDPARVTSQSLVQLTAPEDLIVLQAGSAEHYLPLLYNRTNIMSTRELWYLHGGNTDREAATSAIVQRMWHALAKGASTWMEDRVLKPGAQTSDHYVFTAHEIAMLLSPYGERIKGERKQVGPETFILLAAGKVYSKAIDWDFTQSQAGWSGVNIDNESLNAQGWCFTPGTDPNLWGPPVRIAAGSYGGILIQLSSGMAGRAQIFFRSAPTQPYSEANSVYFNIHTGQHGYSVRLAGHRGWSGEIEGLRLDPVEHGQPQLGANNHVCVLRVQLVR